VPYGITQCYLPFGRGDIPTFTPAKAGIRLSDPGGMQGWVDLVGLLHTRMVYLPKNDHPSNKRARRGLTSFMWRSPLTTAPCSQCNVTQRYTISLTNIFQGQSIFSVLLSAFCQNSTQGFIWPNFISYISYHNPGIFSSNHSCTYHTHTRLTAVCLGLPGWASTRKVKPIWILLKQETVNGSGISWAVYKSAPRSHHSAFTSRM